MNIISEDAKEYLAARLQCMRDVNFELQETIEELGFRRDECCQIDPPTYPPEYVLFSDGQLSQWSNREPVEWSDPFV